MGDEKKEEKLLQWHAAFFADLQIELAEEAEYLTFENEHMLSTKPMQLDVLVIKKDGTRKIKKNIGRIFRGHNIVEYKSPTDSLSIDDFFKVYGYACFYKSDTQRVNEIRSEDVTISFVCKGYPREMCKYLEQVLHRRITVAGEGIYYISDQVFPIQLLVQKRLSKEENFWLKSLTNDLNEKQDVEHLLKEYKKHQTEKLYQSVMNIVVRANIERFQVDGMCEALMEVVEYHVQRLKEKERAEVEEKQLRLLVRKKLLKNKPLSQIADELEETEEVILPLYEQVKAELQLN